MRLGRSVRSRRTLNSSSKRWLVERRATTAETTAIVAIVVATAENPLSPQKLHQAATRTAEGRLDQRSRHVVHYNAKPLFRREKLVESIMAGVAGFEPTNGGIKTRDQPQQDHHVTDSARSPIPISPIESPSLPPDLPPDAAKVF